MIFTALHRTHQLPELLLAIITPALVVFIKVAKMTEVAATYFFLTLTKEWFMKNFFYGWIFLALAAPAFAQQSQEISGQVLYKIKDNVSSEQLQKLSNILAELGQSKIQKSSIENPYVELIDFGQQKTQNTLTNETVIQMLEATGAVDFAESNRIEFEIGYRATDPDFNDQWHHENMEDEKAWEITTGRSDIVVAVCDSGVEAQHEDLKGNVLSPGYNFVTNKAESRPSTSHGTMVAGVIASLNNYKGGVGVAPNSKILPLKITTNGSTSLSTIARCIRYGADQGAKVINVSFTGINSSTVSAAGKYARDKGSLLIYAAGNQGNNQTNYPDWINVVAVGATTSQDKRSSFSNYGNFIDVVAPGSAIFTTAPYITRGTSKYKSVNGTSFAAPIAAGVAALIWSVNPEFTPEQVEKFLVDGADDLGNSYVYGAGRVNSYQSVSLAQAATRDNQKPVAKFVINSDSNMAPAKVELNSAQSFDSDGSIVTRTWYLDGKLAGSGENLVLELEDAKTYEIKLVVTDNHGESNSSIQTLKIVAPATGLMKVSNIRMSVSYSYSRATARAQVKVTDTNNKVLPNAKVSATWDGVVFHAVTDSSGTAFFTSPTNARTHQFEFQVQNIEKDEYEYSHSLNDQSQGSIRAPQVWYRRIFGR